MAKPQVLVERLEDFSRTWIANPAAKLDFARLIRDVHEFPRHDHSDHELMVWIDGKFQTAKRLGIK